MRVCSVCKEEGGEIEGLVPIIDELGLYVGFLWGCALLIVPEPASPVIPTLTHTRGLVACHRCKGPSVPARNMCLVDLHVPTSHKSLELNPDLRSLAATLQQHKKFTAEVWNKSCGSVAAQSDLDYAELAGLLQDVASDGSDAFYTGDVADDIVAKVSNLADLYSHCLFSCFIIINYKQGLF